MAAAVLAVAGASIGLAVWGALQGSGLSGYVLGNTRRAVTLRSSLPSMVTGAWIVLGAAFLAARSAERDARALVFERWAVWCRPLMLSGLLPPLWQWKAWVDRPVGFLTLLVVVAVGVRLSLTNALLASADARAGAPSDASARSDAGARAPAPAWQLAPLLIVVGAAAAYCAYFGYYSVLRHHNLQSSAFDLGIFDNLFWNTVDRHSLSLPSSPAQGPDFRHLERHATFIVFLLAPIYALAPRAETVLWIQAALTPLAAVPLFLIARRQLGAWVGCVIALCFLLYPPLHGPSLFDFHFIMFGSLFLWTSLFLLETHRDRWAALAVALTLLVREDFAIGVAMIGVYLIMTKQRPRAGLLLCAIGVVYVGVTKLFIMPGKFAGGGSFVGLYHGLIPKGAKEGFGAVLRTVVTNPAFTWQTLLTQDKLVYALQIATPLALLPWLRPLGWVLSLPGLLFCLLASDWPMTQISFQYTPHWTAYMFPALIANLAWMRDAADTPARGLARFRAAIATLALCTLLASHQFGGILQQNTLRVSFDTFVFGTTAAQREDYQALLALIAQVPKDARIVASETLVAHVSNRRYAYALRNGVADAEYWLSVTTDELLGNERRDLLKGLKESEFGVIDARRNLVLLRRGADTSRNAAVRKALPFRR